MQDYASLSRRFAACVLDGVILMIPGVLAYSVMPLFGGLVIWFLYAPVLESSEIGATIGKHLMGIQVKDLSGRRISFRAALIRNLMKVASNALLMIGALFALFTARKQTLHDLVADTTVVYGRSELPIFETWLNHLKSLFAHFKPEAPQPTEPASKLSSTVDELERLEALRAKGTLSEEEFQKAKKRILGE